MKTNSSILEKSIYRKNFLCEQNPRITELQKLQPFFKNVLNTNAFKQKKFIKNFINRKLNQQRNFINKKLYQQKELHQQKNNFTNKKELYQQKKPYQQKKNFTNRKTLPTKISTKKK